MNPLVLVHGFMGGSEQWARQQAEWSAHRDVIAVDLPGFGKNNHLPVIDTIGGFADWVIAELNARGLSRYDLMGHSMGGMIVQEMARRDRARVDRLVLYSTGAVGVLPGRFETIDESKARAQSDGVRQTARRIAATWFLHGEDADGYPACATIAEQSADDAVLAGLDAMQSWSGADALGQITQETLILWGNSDRTYPWGQIQRLRDGIPSTQLAVIPGCAHAVHLEMPELFSAAVLKFL